MGGWEGEVHGGYQGIPVQSNSGMVTYKTETSGIDGTFGWAIDAGFLMQDARTIADSCRNVDDGDLGPTKEQGYHFNINFETYPDYSINDSRIILAIKHLNKAKEKFDEYQNYEQDILSLREEQEQYLQELKAENKELVLKEALYSVKLHPSYYQKQQSLSEKINIIGQKIDHLVALKGKVYVDCYKQLGICLHSLQDMYAHTKDFVWRDSSLFLGWQFHLQDGADNTKVQPQRYEDTEIATKLYLYSFLVTTKQINPQTLYDFIDKYQDELQRSEFSGLVESLNLTELVYKNTNSNTLTF